MFLFVSIYFKLVCVDHLTGHDFAIVLITNFANNIPTLISADRFVQPKIVEPETISTKVPFKN